MKTLVVIPARYASTRFPGKPLALLGGKPIIQWVWERISLIPFVSMSVVATDDERICDTVSRFGGRAMMTSTSHRSGTDRCGEVVRNLNNQGQVFDVVINVQGDEPFIQSSQIQTLSECFLDNEIQIATLRTAIKDNEELFSPNNVKVVCNQSGNALYFSRQPIPYVRGIDDGQWLSRHHYYKHVGVYAFRCDTLLQLTTLQPTSLELAESLEQLRWLENGYQIAVRTTDVSNIGIDTPDDLLAAERLLCEHIEHKNAMSCHTKE